MLFKKNYSKIKKSYCLVGTKPGIGVTHLALSIANFLFSKERREVIYIEVTDSSEIFELVKENPIQLGESVAYLYKGVKYLVSASVEEAMTLLTTRDEIIVLDIHELNEESLALFVASDKKIVLGSMKPWCEDKYTDFIKNKLFRSTNIKDIYFIGLIISKKERKKFKDSFNCPIQNAPIIADPFKLTEEEFPEMETLIS